MTKIKNWKDFQHFKDRNPPWIKLHKNILERRDISAISDRAFRVLIGLWLLASEDKALEGTLPEIDDICFRLRMDKPSIIKAIKEIDIFLISPLYQDDEPETETEAYTEEETEVEEEAEEDIKFDNWYSLYPNKKSPKNAKKSYNAAIKNGVSHEDLLEGLTRYCEDIKRNGTETKFIKHPATWINQGCYNDDYSEIVHPGGQDGKPRSFAEIAGQTIGKMEQFAKV